MTTPGTPGHQLRARCSVRGCPHVATRTCAWCGRYLCDECWCDDEVRAARADESDPGRSWMRRERREGSL